MSKLSKIIYFIISIIFFSSFDIVASNSILNNLEEFPENPIIDLISVQNTGAAFSLLQDSKTFLILFSTAAVIAIFTYTIKHIKKRSGMSLFWIALLVAGIFCNLFERIIFGYVRDFFKLNFVNFPVFNISDIFINISVIAIVIIIIKHNFSKSNETTN